MNQLNLKITAVAFCSAVLVCAFVWVSSTQQQALDKDIDQMLAAADKAKSAKGNASVKLPMASRTLPPNHPPTKVDRAHALQSSSIKQQNVTAGPKGDFLKVSPPPQWQLIEQQEGIASIKYRLSFDGSFYDLAVIRMNGSVPLKSVLKIWQEKAGMSGFADVKFKPFKSKEAQTFDMATLKGPFKTIHLAIHKGLEGNAEGQQSNQFTFFRLYGTSKIEDKVLGMFKAFLYDAQIVG